MVSTQDPACDELFDSVVQSLFGIGLQLEDCIASIKDEAVSAKIDSSIHRLHDVIGRIRARGELHCESK